MPQSLRTTMFTILLGLLLTAAVVLPVNAQSITDKMLGVVSAINELPGTPSGGNAENTAINVVGRVINTFISVFGIIFMILIIYSGWKWMTAAGREEEVTKARDILRGSIIGLAIVLAAYSISFFVSQALQLATA